jgi:hypothetical protein
VDLLSDDEKETSSEGSYSQGDDDDEQEDGGSDYDSSEAEADINHSAGVQEELGALREWAETFFSTTPPEADDDEKKRTTKRRRYTNGNFRKMEDNSPQVKNFFNVLLKPEVYKNKFTFIE